ncbi:alpha/beta fold hydrolase [Amycolatopsis sp. DSM 110486]|uniref:alpha/beta fold hydrolase n=1 Tax=Amycolatopsis sp. DSM 110486 TaxID=2865832 RepID=UPI001C699061|nr:alpha/beta hydrolase [Amycolatopsis sp. DSM 110486]QYN23857.1 alpha/beta hydrolase [Amycolatopsis sp. DSM 110486]
MGSPQVLVPACSDQAVASLAEKWRTIDDYEVRIDRRRQIVLELGLGPINLVGMDVGGMVVYAYASRHPDEVRRLVLSETLIPGFGLEEMMNPSAEGGTYGFGFHGQVDLATFLTQGKETEYLTPFYRLTSVRPDAEEYGAAHYLPHFTGPNGIRGGFQHYGAMIEDGKANRAEFTTRLPMPVLVLNGDHGYYRGQLLAGARQVAENIETDVIAQASHAYAFDNPQATAERFRRFFAVSDTERLVIVDEIRQFMARYASTPTTNSSTSSRGCSHRRRPSRSMTRKASRS